MNPSEISSVSVERVTTLNIYIQGWVFAMAKSIFARTVEKTGNNRQMEQNKPCQCHLYKAMKNINVNAKLPRSMIQVPRQRSRP